MLLPRPTTQENLLGGVTALVDALERGIAGKRVAFGTGTLTWPGGNNGSNGLTVAHGLGVAPVIVIANCSGQNITFVVVQSYQSPDATNIYLQGWDLVAIPAINTTRPVYWLAIA